MCIYSNILKLRKLISFTIIFFVIHNTMIKSYFTCLLLNQLKKEHNINIFFFRKQLIEVALYNRINLFICWTEYLFHKKKAYWIFIRQIYDNVNY